MERKKEILQWVKDEKPKYYICQQLGCKPETLNLYLKKMGIEYAGQRNKKGQHKGKMYTKIQIIIQTITFTLHLVNCVINYLEMDEKMNDVNFVDCQYG